MEIKMTWLTLWCWRGEVEIKLIDVVTSQNKPWKLYYKYMHIRSLLTLWQMLQNYVYIFIFFKEQETQMQFKSAITIFETTAVHK